MRPTWSALALAAGLALACPATAQSHRVFTTDDLLAQEGLGAVRVSPDGRWIALETQARYDAAPVYRFAQYTSRILSRIEVFDARTGERRHVIEASDHAAGYVLGPFSPDGRRMVVYRLTATTWTLGVLTLATGETRWTGVSPEETQFGRSVGWRGPDELLVVSRPDGSLPLLFRVGGQPQDRIGALWAATASGSRVGATYIPSGALRDTRDQPVPLQLRLIDVATGDEEVLAEGAIYDFMLSPDGRRLAVMEEGEDLQPALDQAVRVGDPMRRRALRLMDFQGGEVRLSRSLDYAPYVLAWRPDSGALLAFARTPGAADFEDAGAYVVIGADGRIDTLDRASQTPALERSVWGEPVALAGWRDRQPVLRVRDPQGEARWRSPDGTTDVEARAGDRLVDWDGRLHLRRGDSLLTLDLEPVAAGALTGLGDAGDSGNRSSWTPDTSPHRSLRTEGCLQPPGATEPVCVTAPEPDDRVLAGSVQGGVLVTRQDRSEGASRLRVHLPGSVRTLREVNTDRAALDWGDIMEVPHAGPDGVALKSWLLLPPHLAAGARAPLVVDVYVGRTLAVPPTLLGRGSARLQNNPAVLAAAGYAVLFVSLPEPATGRYTGTELASRVLGIVDAAGMDARIATDRVALIGHSYGAYNVLLAAPHSPRFAAVIASNGFADLSTSLTLPLLFRSAPEEGVPIGTLIGWSETGQGGIGRFPEAAERYVSLSPLYDAAALTAPTLLIESDMDRPRYGALFGALYRLNREAALLSYFGEGHTIASPENVRDLHRRILDWLARYLGPPAGDPRLPTAGPDLEDGRE